MVYTKKMNKRSYYRIQEEAFLNYTLLENEHDFDDPYHVELIRNPLFSLVDEIRQIDNKSAEDFEEIFQQNRPMANYLQAQNKKIELIIGSIIQQSMHDDSRLTQINISEGGLSFSSQYPIEAFSNLHLNIILLNSHHCFSAFAKTVY